MSATRRFVDWAWKLSLPDVPDSARKAAGSHLIDGVGCAVAAHRLGTVPYATSLMDTEDEATVIGSGQRGGAAAVAFANGTLMHGLDFDDTHAGALVHATAAVAPAALAVAESQGASGADALETMLAGYEVALRIGKAVTHGFHSRGFHATAICATFAAALIAARLGGLSREQAVAALGIAGSMAAGSLEFLHTGSSTKQLHPGWASHAGIAAASLAASGATGPDSILEGEYGLYRSYTGRQVETEEIIAGLGEEWEVENITIKPYPLCQLSHASLDALRAILPDIEPGDIEEIQVAVPEDSVPVVLEPAASKLNPRSAYEAKFSLQWDLAALALDGAITIATFEDLDRPEVSDLAGKVTYRSYRSDDPPADAAGEVIVRTATESYSASIARSRGGPDNRLTDEELLAKFVANCGDSVAEPAKLAHRLGQLDAEPDVGSVIPRVSM